MKKNNYLRFRLTNLLSLILKFITLIIGINIILTTFFILIKDLIPDNFQKETSYLYLKDIT